ncbi:MAG: polysaccharide biosynthesis/export family protein [Chthoniobacter sp.]
MEPKSLGFPLSHPSLWRLIWILTLLIGAVSRSPHSAAAEGGSAYVLAPNDMIDIKVFQEDDLAASLRVSPAGTIVFPLIGTVNVGGLTPQDAAAAIRTALARDYLVNPQVTVTVTEYGKRRFTVLGQVEKAGTYEMPERENLNLLDAIAMAGGYTRIADSAKIMLKRKVAGKESVMRLNAKVMARDAATAAFEIQPGDVITVGESIF